MATISVHHNEWNCSQLSLLFLFEIKLTLINFIFHLLSYEFTSNFSFLRETDEKLFFIKETIEIYFTRNALGFHVIEMKFHFFFVILLSLSLNAIHKRVRRIKNQSLLLSKERRKKRKKILNNNANTCCLWVLLLLSNAVMWRIAWLLIIIRNALAFGSSYQNLCTHIIIIKVC